RKSPLRYGRGSDLLRRAPYSALQKRSPGVLTGSGRSALAEPGQLWFADLLHDAKPRTDQATCASQFFHPEGSARPLMSHALPPGGASSENRPESTRSAPASGLECDAQQLLQGNAPSAAPTCQLLANRVHRFLFSRLKQPKSQSRVLVPQTFVS